MNKTFDEILLEMKNAYFNTIGEKLDDNSEIMKRLQAVASELYALSCYGDYIFKQAFVQSATGANLDAHAVLRGVTRKTAGTAKGELTFYLNEVSEESITIPQGVVCSVSEKPYLQYITDEEVTLTAGELNVTVSATAISSGEEYNVDAGEITVMVNAPAGIYGVTNNNQFTGGCDEESDLSLRRRIIDHYAYSPNGVSCQSVANVVMDLDFVADCNIPVPEDPGVITVVVKTKSGELSSKERYQVQDTVGFSELVGGYTSVVLAENEDFSIVVEANIRSGFNKTEIEEQITQIVKEICSALKIGEPLALNTISKQLVKIDGISQFNVYSDNAFGEVINCGARNCLHLDELVVNCFDE